MYALPISHSFEHSAKLAAVCDSNIARARYVSERCKNTPYFDNFDQMLSSCDIDTIIIATTDNTHDQYIIKSLYAGYDVICEKPMTIDDARCRAILKAEKETGKKIQITFNVRFMPYVARIRETIKDNNIGDILSVHLEYMLDTVHGADYFRRWHRKLENCGGLLVHKSTHHFDMVNWLIDDAPQEVFAYGDTKFYGPKREKRAERCLDCPYTANCEFYLDIKSDQELKELYLDTEHEDGYHRDQCVFADEITTYDTMSVNVRYQKGAFLTYSLIAHSPYEGWKISINGTKGRIEASDYTNLLNQGEAEEKITLFNRKGEAIVYNLPLNDGVHGGGDEKLQKALFDDGFDDILGQQASAEDGAMSILIGVAANQSILKNKPVKIAELLQDRT
mgnify:CR=1 FL=1